MTERTIAAISSPRGKGGVALIRISGGDAMKITSKVFAPASGKAFELYKSNTVVYGKFSDRNGVFDDGMAVFYKAPRSFTGEDTCELCCHGGPLVTEKLLSACIAAGASYAGRGEFTKRAFLNGKMSLSEAEAVGGMIDAVSEKHLNVSLLQMDGSLSQKINSVYSRLVFLVSSVYAYIDYRDEDMTDVSDDEMKETLSSVLDELKELYETRHYGKAISEGIRTAIVGRPNTGKSSLLNRLSGMERAIVTDTAGTTRDVITEKITLGDVVLDLSDTAGIRESDDVIEQIGVNKAGKEIENAEMVLLVLENTVTAEDEKVIDLIKQSGKSDVTVAVYNKSDNGRTVKKGIFAREVTFSALTGDGVKELINEVSSICGKNVCRDDGSIIVSARQSGSLARAIGCIEDAVSSLDSFTQDIAGMEIENALSALGEIDGKAVTEDIVNDIFSHFCVGK